MYLDFRMIFLMALNFLGLFRDKAHKMYRKHLQIVSEFIYCV